MDLATVGDHPELSEKVVRYDGQHVNGPSRLRQALLRYSPQFVRMFTEKMMTYALGRGVEYSDVPVLRAIVRDAARENNRFSAIVSGIVKSAEFQMRVKAEEGTRISAN